MSAEQYDSVEYADGSLSVTWFYTFDWIERDMTLIERVRSWPRRLLAWARRR